jgi:sugar phosphate isomerase/epimerase
MLSILFEEKILSEIDQKAYFELLKEQQINAFELGLNEELYKKFKLNKKHWKDFKYAYHVPYHAGDVYLAQHIKELTSKEAYENLFSFIDKTRNEETPTIIIHGDMEKKREVNLTYLDYLLNKSEQYHLPFRFALETIRSHTGSTTYSREDVRSLIDVFDSSRLKICADLTHEYRAQGKIESYESDIIHAHFHGFTKDTAHHHLSSENKEVFHDVLRAYIDQVPTVLENLYEEDYLRKLLADIKWAMLVE